MKDGKTGQTIGQWLNWDFEANGYLEINDKNGKLIYLEISGLFWTKREYDSQGNEIYIEYSDGEIIDNRIPEVIEHKGHKYQLIR